MPAYYFAMEGYHAREKSDPADDTLITIQYQKIDLATGEPLEKLTILKEWESSEKSIVTTFYNQFFNPEVRVTHFIPVGINLDYAYEMIIAKCKKYNLPPVTSHQLYYERPRLDLGPVLVLLNDGRFAGASLDSFSSKKSDAGRINKWYEKKEFKPIEHTLRNEAESFLKLFQYLSKYKTRLGIAKKGKPAREKPAQMILPIRPKKALPPDPESPAPPVGTPKKQSDTRKPFIRKSSTQLVKAESRSRRKSPAQTKSPDQRSPAPRNQLLKYSPMKKIDGENKRIQ
jgi:hypothetical protein